MAMRIATLTGGHHLIFVPIDAMESSSELGFFIIMLSGITNGLIKISLSLLLLRIKGHEFWWSVGLWILICSLAIVMIGSALSTIISCNPVSAFWHITERLSGKCWSPIVSMYISYGFGCEFSYREMDIYINSMLIRAFWQLFLSLLTL